MVAKPEKIGTSTFCNAETFARLNSSKVSIADPVNSLGMVLSCANALPVSRRNERPREKVEE
jgi:hypothetical protein